MRKKIALVIGFLIFGYLFYTYYQRNQTFTKVKEFEKVGYYAKDKFRIYSIYTPRTDGDEMIQFARKLWYSPEVGKTYVYFFNDRHYTPIVSYTGEKVDPKYYPYWIAAYYHYEDGSEKFVQYPAKVLDKDTNE